MKSIKNLSLIVICGIFLSQVFVSCSTTTYSGSSGIITKRKYMKGYCIDIKSGKGKTEKFDKNKKENEKFVIKKGNENSIDNLPEIENNEELNLIASNENQIILPKQKIYKLIKIADLKLPVTKSIKLIKRQKMNFKKVEGHSDENTLGIASFAMSLISMILTLIILSIGCGYPQGVAFLSLILGLISVILGIVALSNGENPGFAIAGITIGIASLLILLLTVASLFLCDFSS